MIRFEHEHLTLWRVYKDNGAYVGEIEKGVRLGYYGYLFTQENASVIHFMPDELRLIVAKLDELNESVR